MTRPVKYILLGLTAVLTLTYSIGTRQSGVHRAIDTIRGLYVDFSDRMQPRKISYANINPYLYRKQVNPYRDLPRGFTHSWGVLLYRAAEKTGLRHIATQAIAYTDYFSISGLQSAIERHNGLHDSSVPAGAMVVIPGSIPPLIPDPKNRNRPELIHTRGLYFTGTSAGSGMLVRNLPRYRELGINTVVFDAKDITGIVNYRSRVKDVMTYNTHEKSSIGNIRLLIRTLKGNGFYTVARIALFQDRLLHKKDPALAIRSRRTGGAWNSESGERWLDPTNRRVQDYNIAIAVELAELGVDEIQFDYIRFPTTGDQKDAAYAFSFGPMKREEAIAHFLKRAYHEISSRNARLSIDIFGVVAWGKEIDIYKTGQRIELLAKYCDVISPMLYPSHFNNDFDGYARPGDNPYYFIFKGCQKVMTLSGRGAIIRPWLQAFKWRVSSYDKQYIMKQIQAADDSGAKGYLFWNASNDYGTVYRALEDMGKKKAPADLAAKDPVTEKSLLTGRKPPLND